MRNSEMAQQSGTTRAEIAAALQSLSTDRLFHIASDLKAVVDKANEIKQAVKEQKAQKPLNLYA